MQTDSTGLVDEPIWKSLGAKKPRDRKRLQRSPDEPDALNSSKSRSFDPTPISRSNDFQGGRYAVVRNGVDVIVDAFGKEIT